MSALLMNSRAPVRRCLLINAALLAAVAALLAVFDASLTLGALQGLVFLLYLCYACALQFGGNLLLALLWRRSRPQRARGCLLSALLVPLPVGLLTLAAATLSG